MLTDTSTNSINLFKNLVEKSKYTFILGRSSVLGFGPTTTRFSGMVEVSSAMALESR